jgi:hypothetical protein
MADPESPQMKLLHEITRGFTTGDLVLIAKTLHKDFRGIAYPRSLGHPEKTKEEWIESWAENISLWTTEVKVRYIGCSSNPLCHD